MKPPALARRLAARWLINRAVDLHVEGLEHVPASGPAILVARHYHHLYDAAAILACVPREVHVLVALDWLGGGLRAAPHALANRRRPLAERLAPGRGRGASTETATTLSLRLLSEGRLLLIFPEAYPTIDPSGSHKSEPNELLPFDAGFLVLAERAGAARADSARRRVVRRPSRWWMVSLAPLRPTHVSRPVGAAPAAVDAGCRRSRGAPPVVAAAQVLFAEPIRLERLRSRLLFVGHGLSDQADQHREQARHTELLATLWTVSGERGRRKHSDVQGGNGHPDKAASPDRSRRGLLLDGARLICRFRLSNCQV